MKTETTERILFDDAVRLFGSKSKLARALGITPQALNNWGEYVPELRVYKLKETYPDEVAVLTAQATGGLKAVNQ